ncbi:solute carrier organic anion transporter family member 4A1-like [Lytechinus pictus]|uniref:solute carrier organic anion transporter family member 4A1-like n=1 Tax=Lytechinus pictus TaxID=7653 RepID=UPI0030BA13E9
MEVEAKTSTGEVEKFILNNTSDTEPQKTSFGWMWFRPKCIQVINNPLGYCFMLCLLTICQSMTSFGLVYVNLTTLEKRFAFNSVQSSWISSSYDFCNLVAAVFVTYFGEKGHRPLWVGISSVLFSIGSIIFSMPHFISPNYVYHETMSDLCGLSNQTNLCDGEAIHESDDERFHLYAPFFVIGQFLHGIGSACLYTLGVAYIDENVPTRHFGAYMGVYQGICVIGPSLGYALGGVFLSIYGDLNVDTDTLTIDKTNPLWVGAWWIGFIMNGVLLFIFSIIYMGFPKSLPGGSVIMRDRQFETQKDCEFTGKDGAVNQTKDLPRAVWNLVTNLPFMFMSMTVVFQFFLLATLAVFGPKYIESQLSMSPNEAAYSMGILSVSGGLSGALIGGLLVNRLDLKFSGLMKLCAVCAFLSMSTCCVFTAVCPTIDFAGVTVSYENKSLSYEGTPILSAPCNSHCVCSNSYDPVCGSDGIMYFSACHAGCEVDTQMNSDWSFIDCRCIEDTSTSSGRGTATPGVCDTSCPYTELYYAAIFFILLFGAVTAVSTWTASIRIVSHNQRAFALGIQTLMYGLLGCVPGPIVFGALLDESCLLWETSCEGTGNCWLYENRDSALWFLVLSVSCQFLALVFFLLALISYRPPDKQDPNEHKDFSSDATKVDLLIGQL